MIKMEKDSHYPFSIKTPIQLQPPPVALNYRYVVGFHIFREHPSQCQSCHLKVDVTIRVPKKVDPRLELT